MAESTAGLTELVEKCDVALSVVESAAPYRPPPSTGMDRIPGPTIVRLRAAGPVSVGAMLEAIQSTVDEMRIDKDTFDLDAIPCPGPSSSASQG